jgi:hypothetical protein
LKRQHSKTAFGPLFDNVEKMAGKNDKPRSLLGGNRYISMTQWVLRMANSTGE